MSTESNGRNWLWNVSAGFLCVTGLVTLAMAAVHPAPTSRAPSTEWMPPSMHVAEAGVDVGPGSDEALLVTSPDPR
jgi:hypothetical protein